MKALAALLVFPLTILVKLVSAMLSNLAGLITCRRVMRKTELTSRDLPPLSPPGTPSEARKIMGEPPMQAFALYLRNYWQTRFLILAGLINGILGGLGIMLQDSGIWFPLCLLMALFTFLEMMIFITGQNESLRELAAADPDSLSDATLLTGVRDLVPRYGQFREEALRAVGGPGKTIIIASLALAALLIGLQADWYLRPREKEPGVWQLAGFQYRVLDDGTAEVIRYTGPWKKIRVPSSLHGAPVTSVGEKAFYCPSGDYLPFARKELEEIALPPTLRRIGEGAFWGCGYLRSLTLPDGVTEIGDNAFDSCGRLRALVLPDSVTRIGTEAFDGCSFTSFHIPAGVTEIGGCPFPMRLSTLTIAEDNPAYNLREGALCSRDGVLIWVSKATVGSEYRVPDGIRRIGDRVFSDCGRLERVYLPEGLTGIGKYAFSYCVSLEEIIFPDTVTSIGDYAFRRCRRLSGIDLPSNLALMGIGAFEYCESITRAHIPAGLAEISQSAFDSCTALTDVVIPEGVTAIRLCAFRDCTGLKRITIPSSVRDMDHYALFAPDTVWVVTPGSFAERHAAWLGMTCEYAEASPAGPEPAGDGI